MYVFYKFHTFLMLINEIWSRILIFSFLIIYFFLFFLFGKFSSERINSVAQGPVTTLDKIHLEHLVSREHFYAYRNLHTVSPSHCSIHVLRCFSFHSIFFQSFRRGTAVDDFFERPSCRRQWNNANEPVVVVLSTGNPLVRGRVSSADILERRRSGIYKQILESYITVIVPSRPFWGGRTKGS